MGVKKKNTKAKFETETENHHDRFQSTRINLIFFSFYNFIEKK